jgi:hypothetical protein
MQALLIPSEKEIFMSQYTDEMCADCSHCFPDRDGPTEMGICLLDPELQPYEEEILELDLSNCRHLIQKKAFNLNSRACKHFSAAEGIDLGEDFDQDLVVEAIKRITDSRENK